MANQQLPSNDVIGRGFTYPFHIDEETGSVSDVQGQLSIIKSIIHILDVHYDEFASNRNFGSGIDNLVFSINDSSNDALFQHFVIESLERWEPRIQLLNVEVSRARANEGMLEVGIDFYILQTRESASMVYPFYTGNVGDK